MDKNLLQKAKAPMIALIQTKNIMKTNNLKTKTRRAAALLLMLLMLAPLAAWAQEYETFTLNEGEAGNYFIPVRSELGPNPYGLDPISMLANGQESQFIIPAEDLDEVQAQVIDQLNFRNVAEWHVFNAPTFEVRMEEVTQTAFETDALLPWSSNAVLVYSGSLVVSDQQMVVNLSTPFTYNGGHLMIGFKVMDAGDIGFTEAYWKGCEQSYPSAVFSEPDGGTFRINFLPQFTIRYESSCFRPETLEVGNITTAEATLTWTGGSGTYNLETKTNNGNWTRALTETDDLSYQWEGLSSNSYCQARVQSVCDDGTSGWKAVAFTTPCDPFTVTAVAPYTEGFESPTGTAYDIAGPLPDCWEAHSTGWTTPAPHNCNIANYAHSGSQSLVLVAANNSEYAILPEFSNPISDLQISFWMRTNTDTNGQLQLGYITAEDDGTCNTFTANADFGAASTWTQHTAYLPNVPVTAVRLVFKRENPFANNLECFIDDVEVSLAPDCYPLEALSLGTVYYNSAYLSWELIDNSQTAWDVQVATNEDFTENVTNSVADIHENYLIDGLSGSTTYYVRVKPACSSNLWSNAINFTTSCDPITITADAPYTQGFEDPTGTLWTQQGPLPPCWEGYNNTGYPAPHNTNQSYVHSGAQSLSFHNSGGYAVLPEFSNPINGLQISFWMSTEGTGSGQLQLGYITAEDDGTCNTFTEIASYNSNYGSMVQRTTYLPNVPATAHRLAFRWSATNYRCFVDDVEVSLAPDCYPVSNLSLGEVTSNSAYLSWDLVDDSQTAWDMQVATNEDFNENVTNSVADIHENYLLEGLSHSTHYYVRVRANCNDTHQSEWSNAIDFTTLCGSYEITLDAPYTQGFEDPTGTLWTQHGLLPPCWEGYNNPSYPTPHNTIGSYGAPHIIHSGEQCLSFCNKDGDSYAILPEFSNPISDLQINFWMATNGNTTDKLRLGYITTEDDGTCNTFTEIASYDSNFGSMVQRSKTLENVPAEAYRLAFKWNTSYYYLCFVDDVEVSINPCANPINLAVGNLTQETADITWEGSLGSYAVRHRTAAHYDGTVIDEPFNIDELPAGWDRYQITSIGSFLPTQFGWLFTTYGLGAYNMRCRLYDPNTNYWLVTPGFTVGENYTLSFDVALTDHDNDNPPVTPCNDQTTFIVQITTDNMSSWQTLREWNNSGSEYVLNNIPHTGQNVNGISLADYAGQNVRIAFHCVRTDNNYDWVNDLHIDNVLIGNPVAVAAGEWTDPVAVTGNMHRLTGLTAGTRYDAQVKSNLGECDNWNDVPTFKTLEENAGKFFLYEGNWNEADNWVPAGVPTASDKVTLRADATIPAGSVAFANAIAGTDEHILTVKDGSQLFHYQNINYQNITVTLEKEIAGHDGSSAAGWHFIGSPVVGVNSVMPSAENGFLVNDYDLYYYDEPTHYWMNHKPGNSNSGFGLTYGSGFLYANDEGTTLKISGKVRYSENYATKTGLTHEAEVLNGFNLVGNPFLHNASINSTAYVIDNGAVVAYTEGTKILAPGEGVMVQTTSSFVSFYRVDPDAAAPQPSQLQITVNQEAEQRGEASSTTLLDNAIINFKDGGTLEKFDFGRTDAKVYIPQKGKDYAIVCAEGQNEMPINFKAAKDGTYTLTVNVENMDLDYLHLIDNMTGADIDLLTPAGNSSSERGQGGVYTFTAKTTDYASRFRLVFSICEDANGDNDGNDAPFAYISNGEIVITTDMGDATLQIVDMTGRVIASYGGHTRCVPTSGMPAGVYVLRLVDGDSVRTQKIVIQ